MRKHKQSLSQPTIPEEEESEQPTSAGASSSSSGGLTSSASLSSALPSSAASITSILKPKPESRVVKNLAQELGAFSKDVASSIKKSSSFKEERSTPSASASSTAMASASSMDSLSKSATTDTKSPKLSRPESVPERTMQKLSKMIRGTSRSDSRSKKNREASLSPQGVKTSASKERSGSSSEKSKPDQHQPTVKDKRDKFKEQHN